MLLRIAFFVFVIAAAGAHAQSGSVFMLPDTVDFGEVPVGGNYFGKFVYFRNDTGASVVINSPYIRGQEGNPFAWFSNLIGRFGFGDGRDLSYGVRFHPPWPGHFEDDLCVPIESRPHPCVHIRGRGIEPLTVSAFRGETTSTVVYLPNPGYRTLDVRIRSGRSWLTPLPSFGLIPPGDSLAVTLAINAAELASGMYRDTLRVEALGINSDYVLPLSLSVGNAVSGEENPTTPDVVVGAAYPNPARRATSLPLTLEGSASVAVAVYDLHGREVHESRPRAYGAGGYRLAIDGTGLATGVYHVQVRVVPGGSGPEHRIIRRVVFVE